MFYSHPVVLPKIWLSQRHCLRLCYFSSYLLLFSRKSSQVSFRFVYSCVSNIVRPTAGGCVQPVSLCCIAVHFRFSALRKAFFLAFADDAKCGLPNVSRHICRCSNYWCLWLRDRVSISSVGDTCCLLGVLVLNLLLVFKIKSLYHLQFSFVWRLHQWQLSVTDLQFPCTVHAYAAWDYHTPSQQIVGHSRRQKRLAKGARYRFHHQNASVISWRPLCHSRLYIFLGHCHASSSVASINFTWSSFVWFACPNFGSSSYRSSSG